MKELTILECLNRLSPAGKGNASLRVKQSLFALMVSLLIQRAYELGYEITFGYAFRGESGPAGGLHHVRLAIDLNLFKDGVYLTATEDHRELGLYWESLGGSWGGRFEDGNHYSLAWGGRK